MDYNGVLSEEQFTELERWANEAVWADIPVIAGYPPEEELKRLDYRSKIELTGPVRIVSIEGVDVCACCAPHVWRTGEIGLIKLIAHENYKGGIRLHALCGGRALADYGKKQGSLEEIIRLLSAKPGDEAGAVKARCALLEEEKQKKADLERAYAALLLEKYPVTEAGENLILFEPILGNIALRELVNALTARTSGYVLALSGSDTTGYRYILASAKQDVKPVNELLRSRLNAKGGGSSAMIQGSLTATEAQIRQHLALQPGMQPGDGS